jgi:hypothetical protein
MGTLAELERRMATATPAERPDTSQRSSVHRRKIAVTRFEQEVDRGLSGEPSALRRKRLEVPMTVSAAANLAGIARDTWRRAEQGDPRVSTRTWSRIGNVFGCLPRDIRP